MSTADHEDGDGSDKDFVNITDLVRRCASECLSYSRPFTPHSKRDGAASFLSLRRGSDDNDRHDAGAVDNAGTLLKGLRISGTSVLGGRRCVNNGEDERGGGEGSLTPLDLQEAMTALELGDERMDCCEIPFFATTEFDGDANARATIDGDDNDRERHHSLDSAGSMATERVATYYPPRIAPINLSDGTPPSPLAGDAAPSLIGMSSPLPGALLVPESPCHSLLPHWDALSLASSEILPLLILQLTALEAYIGTDNGGSNAAETLYCMMWCHDGVLADMAERLGANVAGRGDHHAADDLGEMVRGVEELQKGLEQSYMAAGTICHGGASGKNDLITNDVEALSSKGLEADDERTVAQWVLFASSLGVVRIAEAIRWVVVNVDFYEEEDFGVALHGGKGATTMGDCSDGEQEKGCCTIGNKNFGGVIVDVNVPRGIPPLNDAAIIDTNNNNLEEERKNKKGGGRGPRSSMRFCPSLQGSQYVEVVWDMALSYLRLHRASRSAATKGGRGNKNDEIDNSTIDALETILRAQQSFFQAVKILSNLNEETVRNFTEIAVKRSRETVSLLKDLRGNEAFAEVVQEGLVGSDGRLLRWRGRSVATFPTTSTLLSASFDPFVNRRLLGSAPVRRARFGSPTDAIASLLSLASELEWGVCDLILRGNTFGRITRMLEGNSLRGCGGAMPIKKVAVGNKKNLSSPMSNGKERKEADAEVNATVGMNILTRSLVVLNLYFDDKLFGQHELSAMIGQHMTRQCGVPQLLLEAKCPDGLPWLTRLTKPMYDALKALCLNRHRERGFTESILIPAFQQLQYDAATVDERFKEEHGLDPRATPSYATNYVILNTIRLLERHVGLGIELGLYPNWYDLSTALWYRDFLLSALLNVRGSIERERTHRREMDQRIKLEHEEEERKARTQQLQLQQSKKKGKTKRSKKIKYAPINSSSPPSTTEDSMKPTEEDFEDSLEVTSLLLHRNLCRGLVRYIAALRQAEILLDPPGSITMFTTHQMRFEKRFETFGSLPQPPHLSYEDYVRGSDFSAVQSEDLLASATDCFRSGKSVVDWLLGVIVSNGAEYELAIDPTEKRRDDDFYISIHRDEIIALAKVCVTNSLFLHKLTSAVAAGQQKSGSIKVSLEFKAHKQYCTLSIT